MEGKDNCIKHIFMCAKFSLKYSNSQCKFLSVVNLVKYWHKILPSLENYYPGLFFSQSPDLSVIVCSAPALPFSCLDSKWMISQCLRRVIKSLYTLFTLITPLTPSYLWFSPCPAAQLPRCPLWSLLYLQTAAYVTFQLTIPRGTSFGLYARRNALPTHTHHNFMEVISGLGEAARVARNTEVTISCFVVSH